MTLQKWSHNSTLVRPVSSLLQPQPASSRAALCQVRLENLEADSATADLAPLLDWAVKGWTTVLHRWHILLLLQTLLFILLLLLTILLSQLFILFLLLLLLLLMQLS